LKLEHAAELFKAQFGSGTDGVQFRMKDFRESFHQIFLSCKAAKTTLHPNFFGFGIYLSSLYEHLEGLDETFHVGDVFREIMAVRKEAKKA